MTSQRSADVASFLAGPAYLVGLLFVFTPFVDSVAQVWPPMLGSAGWRYGLVGIGANFLISVLFGILLLAVVAAVRGHRSMLRAVGVLSLILALASVGAAIAFALDALQVRTSIPGGNAQALRMFDIGAVKAGLKYLVSALVLLWMTWMTWRAARAVPHDRGNVPKLVNR